MKILGLIGGTSWVSTIDYYRYINQMVHDQTAGRESAECIIYSLNHAEVKRNNVANAWDRNMDMIVAAARHLIDSGARAIVICANTQHLMADRVQELISVPIIHIAVETAGEIKKKGLRRVGLLGTKYTMELDFYKDKLKEQNIETIVPGEEDRTFIHQTITDEMGNGIFTPETKARYAAIIRGLIEGGAEGVILGCTEIPLLIGQQDVAVPVFDTTWIHSQAAVRFSLS